MVVTRHGGEDSLSTPNVKERDRQTGLLPMYAKDKLKRREMEMDYGSLCTQRGGRDSLWLPGYPHSRRRLLTILTRVIDQAIVEG
jgi:hypothetical protein